MSKLISLVERTARLYYMRVRSSAHPVCTVYTRVCACVYTRVRVCVHVCVCVCVCGACVSLFRAYERCTACTHGCRQPSCHPLDVHEMFIDPKGSRCLPRGISPWFKGCTTEIDSAICQFKPRHDIDSSTECPRTTDRFQ